MFSVFYYYYFETCQLCSSWFLCHVIPRTSHVILVVHVVPLFHVSCFLWFIVSSCGYQFCLFIGYLVILLCNPYILTYLSPHVCLFFFVALPCFHACMVIGYCQVLVVHVYGLFYDFEFQKFVKTLCYSISQL